MKKSVLLSLGASAVLGVLPVQADINFVGSRIENSIEIMNTQFLIDKNPAILIEEEDENTNATTFIINDSKLNEIARINVPEYPEVTATLTRYQSLDGPIGVFVQNTWDNNIGDNVPEEEFLLRAQDRGFTKRVDTDGKILMYNEEVPDYYYYYEIFGTKYPTYAYMYDGSTMYERITEYGYEQWGNIGFGNPQEDTDSKTPYVEEIYPKSELCGDMDEMTLTQTLFNNDAQYEWIIPVYEAVDINYENEYEKVEGQKIICTGFKVMSQNGSTVATVKFPAGYANSYLDLDLYILGSDLYLIAEVNKYENGSQDYNDSYSVIYSVTPGNSSVKQMGAPRHIKVNPTTPRRGTPVNVNFDNDATRACKLTVVAASGATVMTREIPAGVSSASIETANLQAGMYLVNINDGKSIREAAKIIVR